MSDADPPTADVPPSPDAGRVEPRRVRSDELFAGAREIVIEHHGRMYRMRITPNGKLILTA
ncbi:MAG: hemin uptake protein HemP [Burkholderiales bacterium]